MSYGADTADIFRRSAHYVDRILKGAKPADLPVQAPIKYELVINLKTATALRLDVPDMLLATVDEVISEEARVHQCSSAARLPRGRSGRGAAS
jgi:putative ABC transport system substrate-binding protein